MPKTVPYQGRSIEVEEVEQVTGSEPWNEYQLANGAVLRVKTVLMEVYKAISEKGEDGDPLYVIRTANHVRVKGV